MAEEQVPYTLGDHDLIVTNKVILGELAARVEGLGGDIKSLSTILDKVKETLGGGLWERIAVWALGVLFLALTGAFGWLLNDHLRVSAAQSGRLTREEQFAIRDETKQLARQQQLFEQRLQQLEMLRRTP